VERIPIGELDLASPDLRHHGPAPAGRIDPAVFHPQLPTRAEQPRERSVEAKQLIARAIAAKGGLSVLRSIQTVRVESVAAVGTGDQTAELPSITTIRYPSSYRMDVQTPSGPVVQVFNAGSYWIQDARGAADAPPAVAEQIQGVVQRDTVPLLLALADGRVTAKLIDSKAAGTRALEVSIPGARPVTLWIDEATGLIAKSTYRVAGDITAEEVYSDYRDVNGVRVAFRTELRREGAPGVTRTVRKCEFNVTVDSKIFNKPS
jgi:hypothetical protein